MASTLPAGSRQRAQLRKRGQSIAKTFKTKGAAEALAREKEVEIGRWQSAVDAATFTLSDPVKKYREARAESDRAMKPKSREHSILQRPDDAFEGHFATRLAMRYRRSSPVALAFQPKIGRSSITAGHGCDFR